MAIPKTDLERFVGEVTDIITNADGNLFAETYNQLNVYFADVPWQAIQH